MSFQMVVVYTYTLNPRAGVAALPITSPILMQPPLTVSTGRAAPGATPLPSMIADLTSAIASWFATNMPSTASGVLTFSLTAMTSLTAQPKPLLALPNLELALTAIDPALPGTSASFLRTAARAAV